MRQLLDRIRGTKKSRFLLAMVGVLGFSLVLEVAVRSGVIPEKYFPAPTTMLSRLIEMAGEPTLWRVLGQTLQGWFGGIALTVLLAIPLGVLIGTIKPLYRSLIGLIEFLRPVPPVALIPVAVLLYGSSNSVVIALVVTGAFWPLLIQVIYGVRDVDPVGREMARSYGLSRTAQIVKVVLPGSLPFIMTGLRLATTIGLVLAVSAEFIVGVPGLGAEMVLAYQVNDLETTYGLVIVTGILGMASNYLFRFWEGRVMKWHPSVRGEVAV